MIHDTKRFILLWLVIAVLYFLFAGRFSVAEAIACLPASLAAAGLAVAMGRFFRPRFAFSGTPWMRVIVSPILALPPDALRVGRALAFGEGGVFSRQRFREGDQTPEDTARRALVTLGISLPPNGYVVRIEPKGLLLHRLQPVQPASDLDWPL